MGLTELLEGKGQAMTFRSIYFDDADGSRLKNFSAASKASGATTTVKIELEICDPARLAMLLQDLGEIKRDQGKPKATPLKREPDPAPATKRTARMAIGLDRDCAPLMLTFDGDGQ